MREGLYQGKVENDDVCDFPMGTVLILVILAVVGFWYVHHVNSQDSSLIEACKHDAACVNPFTKKGL